LFDFSLSMPLLLPENEDKFEQSDRPLAAITDPSHPISQSPRIITVAVL
jgi:hypothetical protein